MLRLARGAHICVALYRRALKDSLEDLVFMLRHTEHTLLQDDNLLINSFSCKQKHQQVVFKLFRNKFLHWPSA